MEEEVIPMQTPPLRYRAVFVSDFHLGAAACKADAIQHFLESLDCEYLYLVGDIIDLWVSVKSGKWRQKHTNVISTVLAKSEVGCKVFYTPGNHDALLRKINGAVLGNVLVDHSVVHTTAQGQRLLVVHGDLFDRSVTSCKPLAWSATWVYEFITVFLDWRGRFRSKTSEHPKHTAGGIKARFKRFIQQFTSFEDQITHDTREQGLDGVVCGHIHKPKMETQESGTLYINTGDWVENCTAVVEHLDGRLELIRWEDLRREIETHDLALLPHAEPLPIR